MSEKAQKEDRVRAAGERYMRKPKNLASLEVVLLLRRTRSSPFGWQVEGDVIKAPHRQNCDQG